MGSTHELHSFWSSLVTENGISPHVESLMKIIDTEERSLALMSRVFFLWCMGIKYQREDLEHIVNSIRTILNKPKETKSTCSKCTEVKALLEKTDFVKSPESLNDCTNISSKRKNLSKSPPQSLKKLCTRDKENVDGSPETFPSIEILAPETEPFLQMKDIVNKEFIIPETVQVDDGLYGNTDFFNLSQDLNEKSPTSKKCNTSPILGKICKPSSSPSVQSKTPTRFSEPTKLKPYVLSPSKIKEKSPCKIISSPDSVNSSPSLLGCNIINKIPIFAHPTSPVRKGKIISINNSKEGVSLTPSKSKLASGLQSEVANSSFHSNRSLRSTPSRNPLMKCKSEMGSVLSNRGRLSRIKTLTSLKDEKSKLEVSLEPKGKGKSYRQTKITKDSFLKPTNVVRSQGGTCDIVDINEDDEKALEEAIEASLHSKEIEDLLRKKHEEIDKEIQKKEKKVNSNPAENSVRRSPRNKCQKSLNFGSPSKGNNSKVSEEEVLADLEKDHVVKNKEEDVVVKVKKAKKNIFHDSFDVLPTEENDEPGYAYKGNVVRKNCEKQKLQGWSCHECRDFYESKDLTEEERKALQNKYSRHRSKYRPVTNTPEGFWNVGWSDEEET